VQALLLLLTLSIDYTKDVYPIWVEHCFGCHAAGVNMGSLDLENWEGVLRGGNTGPIIVPGKSAESRLYRLLTAQDSPAMPMDGKVLPKPLIEKVRRWIDEGAKPPEQEKRKRD
jgi:hypothetical protein